MAVLSSKTIPESQVLATGKSFGPFIAVDDDNFRFDTQIRNFPIWLGHVPTAMCGVLQYQESWTGEWSPEMLRFKQSYLRLLKRTKVGLCGKLKLRQFELTDPDVKGSMPLRPAGMIYQFIAVSILEQFSQTHQMIADSIQSNCQAIFAKQTGLFVRTFVDAANFEFGFEFKDAETYEAFVAALPQAGIHNKRIESNCRLPDQFSDQPSGANRCVFVLNLAYRENLDLFWDRLDQVFSQFRDSSYEYASCPLDVVPVQRSLLEFQRGFQHAQSNRKVPPEFEPTKFLRSEFENRGHVLKPVVVNQENYRDFRERILEMQIATYEPARRSPSAEFDMLFESAQPLSIIVLDENEIAAMVFAGRLEVFQQERGVSSDPFLKDATVYYSMDLTVAPKYRGGMGTLMKQAMVMLAIDNGVTALHGRNRDRLAAGMWAINLSLGSYELQHLTDDYPDDEQYRDCIYYRCPLTWERKLDQQEFGKLNNRRLLEGCGIDSIALTDLE